MTDDPTKQYKVLMVDDETDIVGFFAKAFENFKHVKFMTSHRALEGIEIAKRERPSVVLLDLRMPEMNGEEALVELKKVLPETKFIIMTGWDEGNTQEHLESLGVAAYFKKPVDLEKVITKVMNLIMVKE